MLFKPRTHSNVSQNKLSQSTGVSSTFVYPAPSPTGFLLCARKRGRKSEILQSTSSYNQERLYEWDLATLIPNQTNTVLMYRCTNVQIVIYCNNLTRFKIYIRFYMNYGQLYTMYSTIYMYMYVSDACIVYDGYVSSCKQHFSKVTLASKLLSILPTILQL